MPTIFTLQKEYLGKISHLDLEILISNAIKKPREFVLAHPEFTIDKKKLEKINNFIARRKRNEPLAYILGRKEFFGFDFSVNKHTLIPRPETEQLVDLALEHLQKQTTETPLNVLDIGTGSGNIIITTALNTEKLPLADKTRFWGLDISPQALRLAKKNARFHKVDNKINFLKSDLLSIFTGKKISSRENFLLLANLPYLSFAIYRAAMPDVKNYEPRSALLSPQNGLAHYARFFSQLKKILPLEKKTPTIILEFSPEQKIILQKIIHKNFPTSRCFFFKDLAGKWRLVKISF